MVRSVVIPDAVEVDAVAAPTGASFMIEIDGYLALVDANGGISLLAPAGVDLKSFALASAPFGRI